VGQCSTAGDSPRNDDDDIDGFGDTAKGAVAKQTAATAKAFQTASANSGEMQAQRNAGHD
jgi:hypothetical protein